MKDEEVRLQFNKTSDNGYNGEFYDWGGTKVEFSISPIEIDRIMKRLMEYYSEYAYIGEVIHQSDGPIIHAPDVLSDICDNMIEFRTEEDIQ